ncbi:MAG: sulfatase [Planctomycetota bacterium]
MLRRSLPLVLVLAACGSNEAAPPAEKGPPPVRVRLFDAMDTARVTAPSAAATEVVPRELAFDFDAAETTPTSVWFATPERRRLRWLESGATIDAEGGREGGAMRLGPGVAEDYSRASLLVPVAGRHKVVVEARVRIEGLDAPERGSNREALRLYEHRGAGIEDPTAELDLAGERVRRRRIEGAMRRIEPNGWDHVRAEVVTSRAAATLEIHLLHRTGGSESVVTRFDDLRVTMTPMDEAAYLAHLVRRYRPRDGQESLTPWRLRVDRMGEVRDCVLVPASGEVAIDCTVPPAESNPQLRFGLGALPEASRVKGDGARMTVAFLGGDSDGPNETELGVFELDPKNERGDRAWRETLVDLTVVGGRTGALAFRASDVDNNPDELDALLVATPRIEPAEASPLAMNVLLIGVDTLRADHLSAFGYERPTSPNLKALADEGVRFQMARSPAPWTLPSFSSMLTSLYPSAHGAGRGGHDEWEAIDPTTVSVAEVLARNGYETAGVVANGLISPRYGLDQGFDRYRSGWSMESVASDAPRVAEFVSSHTATPWLMFWHIMDPHLPYMTPEEERTSFTDASYDGRFSKGGRQGPAVPFQVLDPRPGRRWYAHEGPPPAPDLTKADAKFVVDYYDAEIAEMDEGVGAVIQALKDSGQWDRTIVAFVADHGEGLGDHGHYHHGYTLFDDQVHVPMLLRIPGRDQGRVVERPVSTVDLMPTLLGASGIPAPDDVHGIDRLAADAPAVDATFIEYPTYDSSAQKAWVEGRFKFLHDPVFHTEALYDFVADPEETIDVAAEHPDVVMRAREALAEFRVEHLSAGRFHMRLRGKKGQRLQLRVRTNDLFDANFLTRPAIDEADFEMDLDRSYLALDTVLANDRLELRFWCRGSDLDVEATLDGVPLQGLTLDDAEGPRAFPTRVARDEILQMRAEDLGWPGPGQARMWLEAGASEALPVVNTPEEVERLRELGYSH